MTIPGKTISRRAFLGGLGVLTGGAVGGFSYLKWFEPGNFEVTCRRLPLPGGPFGGRVLHLSDFHASDALNIRLLQTAVDIALRQNVDAIFLTGDYITDALPAGGELGSELKRLAEHAPVFAVFGNHDGGGWAGYAYRGYSTPDAVGSVLKNSGVRVLKNGREEIRLPRGKISVAGIADLWSGAMRPVDCLSKKPEDAPVIVLSHNPDSKDRLVDWHWDAMLCGHTHGGQCVIPMLGIRPFLPVKDRRFVAGLYDWNGLKLHITRGVGSLYGLRFNCRPEISILEI